jgi:RimJ/RimL family protein N-acetyltransferase
MEKMPFHAYVEEGPASSSLVDASGRARGEDWRQRLPLLVGSMVTLREIETKDAPTLLAMLSVEEVARFISPPPTTIEGFERFITWAHHQRQAGDYVCYGVVPHGMSQAIGLFQVRRLDLSFECAEWGFAIGANFWGTGMFIDGGRMTVDFAMKTLRVRRLEARAAIVNGRGNAALRKMGAVQEGVLRGSFLRNGRYLDQVLWSILDTDWRQLKSLWGLPAQLH